MAIIYNELISTYMAGWKQMTRWERWHTESQQMTVTSLNGAASLAHLVIRTIRSQLHIRLSWKRWRICSAHNHQAVTQKS